MIKKIFGPLAVTTACLQWVLSPLAIAEEAANLTLVKSVKELIHVTELGTRNDVTFGEFYQKIRGALPEEMQATGDTYVMFHRHEKMPDTRVVTFKDSYGREQVRLILRDANGSEVTLATAGTLADPGIKVNNVLVTTKNSSPDILMDKIAAEDPQFAQKFKKANVTWKDYSLVASSNEVLNMTPEGQLAYLAHVSDVVRMSEEVLTKIYGDEVAQHKFNFSEMYALLALGQQAVAGQAPDGEPPSIKKKKKVVRGQTGESCLYSGWISEYGKSNSCGGPDANNSLAAGINDFLSKFGGDAKSSIVNNCTKSEIPCHPLVFGFDSNTPGKLLCAQADRKRSDQTQQCAKLVPYDSSKKDEYRNKIAETWAKALGKGDQFKTTGMSKEMVDLLNSKIADLNIHVVSASKACYGAESIDPKNLKPGLTKDQESACNILTARQMESFKFTPEVSPPAITQAIKQEPDKIYWSKCTGKHCREKEKVPPAKEVISDKKKNNDNEGGGFWASFKSGLPWLLGGIAGGFIIGSLLGRKKVTNNCYTQTTYFPPAPQQYPNYPSWPSLPTEGGNKIPTYAPAPPTSPSRPQPATQTK